MKPLWEQAQPIFEQLLAQAANPFQYLLAIATHADAVKLFPQAWLPWNYPKTKPTADTSYNPRAPKHDRMLENPNSRS
jgi:hypothetical protein